MKRICLLTVMLTMLLTACGYKEGMYFKYNYNNIAEVNIYANNDFYQKNIDSDETKAFVKEVIDAIKDRDAGIDSIDGGSDTLNNVKILGNGNSGYIEIIFKNDINICHYKCTGNVKGKKYEYKDVSAFVVGFDGELTLIPGNPEMGNLYLGFGNEKKIKHIFDKWLQ